MGLFGMNIDLNPMHSSYFTGAGTPWGEGPQDPYKAQYKAFNPGEYQGMDTSAIGHAMRQQLGQNTARATSRMQGALQRGGGGGADAISGMAHLQSDQGMNENLLNANLAQQDYMQRYNQWKDMMGMESEKAKTDMERYNRDQQTRNAPMQFLGNMAGMGLGAFAGGAGSSLGASMFGAPPKYGPVNSASGF